MTIDIFFIAKVILIAYLWVLITLCTLFILNSKKLYSNLKAYEDHFRKKKREVIHNFVPVMASISRQNRNFQSILEINKSTKKEVVSLLFPIVCNFFMLFQSTKLGIDLTKKLRNNIFS